MEITVTQITVTQKHWDRAKELTSDEDRGGAEYCSICPIALATADATKEPWVFNGWNGIPDRIDRLAQDRIWDSEINPWVDFPKVAHSVAIAFDHNKAAPKFPITFDLDVPDYEALLK